MIARVTTGYGSLIVTNLDGRITFVSEPVPGCGRHYMAKLKGSECETILKMAAGVFGDKGFIGTDYITTPVLKPEDRELYMREHDYNNQVSSLRTPVERTIAHLKTCRILFTDYRRRLEIRFIVPGSHRLVLLQGEFRISHLMSHFGTAA